MSIANRSLPRQKGASLVELMVGITVGLIVLAAISGPVINNLQANRDAVKSTRLNQELRAAMDLMVRDIRRANYDPAIQGQLGNPSLTVTNYVSLAGTCGGSSCPQLNYGYNGTNKILDLVSSAVRLKEGGASPQPLTDPLTITVTSLEFCYVDTHGNADPTDDTCGITLPSANVLSVTGTSNKIRILPIKITISGQLQNDSSVHATLTETVRIRNDSFTS